MPWVNGIWFDAPAVKTAINDANFQGAPNVGGLGVLLIGPSVDGKTNTLLGPFSTPNDAITQLKGGDLLQGILNTFAGATFVGGPVSISAINVDELMPATSNIPSSGGVVQIALTTVQQGLSANTNKWMVSAGSTVGYKVQQASDYQGPAGRTYPSDSQDNISLPILTIACTAATPTVSATDSALTVNSNGTVIATVALGSTVTVQQVVNQLNQVSTITASVADPNPSDTTAALFDNVTNGTLSATPTTLYGNVEAVVRYFNNANLYFTAVRQAGATAIQTSASWTYATGGTSTSATNADWQNAYTTAQSTTGVTFVQPVSSAQSVWAMNDAHCKYMASIGVPRRGYLGDASGQSLTAESTAQAALNSNRSTLVWPEQQGTDYNGNTKVTFPPYLVACSIVGARAATPLYNALTQQPVPSSGMAVTVTPAMVAQGLASGIAVVAPNQAGTVVLQQDRTTWLQSTAYDKVENSTGLCVDIVAQDLNATMQPFIGQPTPIGVATAALFARLNYWYQQKYLVAQPKLSDIQLTQPAADQLAGSVLGAFAVPTNYIGLQLTPIAVA